MRSNSRRSIASPTSSRCRARPPREFLAGAADADALITSWGIQIDSQIISGLRALRGDRCRQRRRRHGRRRCGDCGRYRRHERAGRFHRRSRRSRHDAAVGGRTAHETDGSDGRIRRLVQGAAAAVGRAAPDGTDAGADRIRQRRALRGASRQGVRPARDRARSVRQRTVDQRRRRRAGFVRANCSNVPTTFRCTRR